MYKRAINLPKLLKLKSFFLFGPRSTGKSTLIREHLPQAMVYDLLDYEIYNKLLKHPKTIEEEVEALDSRPEVIVIDEVQKLPHLLDEVHRLIEQKNYKFLLTGSSARKLKHGGANLLAGRAWQSNLFSLTSKEITDFDLIKYLNIGGLPQVYTSSYPNEELKSYVNTYLREEVQAEALTRNIQAFAEFLDAIALSNAEEINYEGLARDCQISPSTLKNYIQILEDTLIGFKLEAYTKTKKRKAITRSKHYLFDIGITNRLCNRGEIKPKSELFGKAFEHFIILELRAYLSYFRKDEKLSYWRSTSQFEVDAIIGNKLAIEIKATSSVNDSHLKGLRALMEENQIKSFVVVSLDKQKRKTDDGIIIWPWKEFLSSLWNDQV